MFLRQLSLENDGGNKGNSKWVSFINMIDKQNGISNIVQLQFVYVAVCLFLACFRPPDMPLLRPTA